MHTLSHRLGASVSKYFSSSLISEKRCVCDPDLEAVGYWGWVRRWSVKQNPFEKSQGFVSSIECWSYAFIGVITWWYAIAQPFIPETKTVRVGLSIESERCLSWCIVKPTGPTALHDFTSKIVRCVTCNS
eukprot:m.267887 g.267887  ORF g.267887 m.267887 type:complete len:130 (-) comp75188_c0_seq1:954-1343(-)